MLLAELVATSQAVRATRSRNRKVALLAERIAELATDEVEIGVAHLAGTTRQERLDLGPAALRDVHPDPAGDPRLTLVDVDRILEEIASVSGPGSRDARLTMLHELLTAATRDEQSFLRSLVLGELRQGALEGVVTQAVAEAFGVDVEDVRRAVMLRGDLAVVAATVAEGGSAALSDVRLELFQPLQPMLATNAGDLDAAVEALDVAVAEYKLDGARVQIHRRDDAVRIYTRNLRDVTDRLGEIVRRVLDLPVERVVLDGEVIALRDDGRPYPFQDTMRRFGTEEAPEEPDLALDLFLFDVLHLDGDDLLDEPLSTRSEALHRIAPDALRVPGRRVEGRDEAAELLDGALRAGHEGIVVKDPGAAYEAGRRGAAWRKVKPVHTLDLVVLAAEWGHGRRRGRLSNLHLGARDGDGFVMLGKTFKGMTDAMLAWQTERFLELERDRDGHVVHLRPEVVVEVAFDGVQTSSRYPGGVALRFARVKGYRHDKDPVDADTVETVRAIHAGERLPEW